MRHIGTKYHTEGEIYKFNGELIPHDEPLILFRSRDRLVPQLLDYYLKLRIDIHSTPESIELLQTDIEAIKHWQSTHPDQVRTPQ